MRPLPLRLKLALAFTVVMALVLGATGLFLHLQLRAELDHTVNQGLRSRAGDVSALVQQSDTGLKDAAGRSSGAVGTNFAQIVDAQGRVFDATAGLGRQALLSTGDLRKSLGRTLTLDRRHTPAASGPVRLLAAPVRAQGKKLVIVVGASLEDRNRALANLDGLLLIGGPIALVLASVAGYGLATAALRPVESMRRRAAAISTEQLDQRLPLSPGRDELHRLGKTLNEMLARLEAGLARERAFTTDASHELRTPLAILTTELELIARERPSGRDLDRAVASAIEEARRLAQLAEDLLVLARADGGTLPVRPQRLAVADVFAAAVERSREQVSQHHGAIVIEAPDALAVRADPMRLEQALANMIDNALRYGGGTVRLGARLAHGMVELRVSDDGSGFPPDFLPHAFDRFARADTTRGDGGTGLGLGIVRAVAESHGGRVGAANRRSGGADVWLTVPAARQAAAAGTPALGGVALL